MMTATGTCAARIDAASAQRSRLHGSRKPPGLRWDRDAAERFSYDPHRYLVPIILHRHPSPSAQ